MGIHFSLEHWSSYFPPVVANLGECLMQAFWSPIPSPRFELSSERAEREVHHSTLFQPLNKTKGFRPPLDKTLGWGRLSVLIIRLARAVGRYPYKNEMCSERNPLGGRSPVVGRKDYKDFPGETPTGHNQETHRDTQKIIRPKDSNKSRPHLPEALAGMAGQRSRPRHHSPECTQSSGDSPLRISLLLRQAAAY